MERWRGIFRGAVSVLLAVMVCVSMWPVGAYAAGTVSGAGAAGTLDGESGAGDGAVLGEADGHFVMSVSGMRPAPRAVRKSPRAGGAAATGEDGPDMAWATAKGAFVPEDGSPGTEFDPDAPSLAETPQGRVKVSKTARATGNENEFEVTLNVATKDVVAETPLPNDAAITLVLDRSGSMTTTCTSCGSAASLHTARPLGHAFLKSTTNPSLNKCQYVTKYVNGTPMKCNKTRAAHVGITDHALVTLLDLVKGSACDFLDALAANADPGTHRYVSVVLFDRASKQISFTAPGGGSASWLDITDPNNLAAVKSGIKGVAESSGTSANATNLQQGLVSANSLMNNAAVSDMHRQNKFTVLFSDGVPTWYGTGTAGTLTVKDSCAGAITAASSLRSNCRNIYSIYFDNEAGTTCYDSDGRAVTPRKFLETFSTSVCTPGTANELADDFQQISVLISNIVQSWSVDDPMGGGVQFKGVTSGQGGNVAKFGDGKLVWNLKADTPVRTGDENAYQLKYLVDVDSPATGYEEGDVVPLSGYTYLSYAILNDNGQMVDESGNVKEGQVTLDTVAFNVPGVVASVGWAGASDGFELPRTGGTGTGPYVSGGAACAVTAGLLLLVRRRWRGPA